MKEVIGVRFRSNGKIYYFDPLDFNVPVGTDVVVETSQGMEFGHVILGRREVDDKNLKELRPIVRVATVEDKTMHEQSQEKSKKAYETCKKKIQEHGLEMKLISAEYTFDSSKVLFYFTAEGRVDFRNLVRDLASVFKTRIELRQIGVRDEAKMCGGIGLCGRELCCHAHLSEFEPVSIKMAKEQGLSLNPTKISGYCGRLMCCLNHEEETYEYLNARTPGVGDFVKTNDGREGIVSYVNVLRQTVRVLVTDEEDNKEIFEYKADDIAFRAKKPKGGDNNNNNKPQTKEEAELAKLEASDKQEQSGKKNQNGKKNHDNQKRDNQNGDKSRGDNQRGDNQGKRNQNGGKNKGQNGDNQQGGKKNQGKPQGGQNHNQGKPQGGKNPNGDAQRGDNQGSRNNRPRRDRNNRPEKKAEGETSNN